MIGARFSRWMSELLSQPIIGVSGERPAYGTTAAVEPRRRSRLMLLGIAGMAVCCVIILAGARTALADTGSTTYSATQTVPVPPQSTFPGSGGGGDGWAVALSNTQLFNVFHHNTELGVECHNQADGSKCWPDDPTFITDGSGNRFMTSGQPGIYLDQAQGKLYVYAERAVDGTGGVVCVDVSNPTADPTFCGFTALTAVGDASLGYYFSVDQLADEGRLQAVCVQLLPREGVTGTRNTLLCFDLSTDAACAGQPFTVDLGMAPNTTMDTSWPSPMTVAIDNKLFMPLADSDGNQLIACWDPSTQATCAGAWPITLGFPFAGDYGGPFPMLDSTGNLTGLCLPTPSAQCYNLDGSSATTPAGLPGALAGGSSVDWNGGGAVVGPRVYIPQWSSDVACFDYSAGASCAGFPKYFSNLDLLYTVNPDPQRPTCLWVNSDNGSEQIQNFDAFGGNGCGQGAIRVLASQFVVPSSVCTPASYQSLQITDPAASTYDTSGSPAGSSITFEDADGNPINGVPTQFLDNTGTISLAGETLNGPLGLPQFLISLVNPTSPVSVGDRQAHMERHVQPGMRAFRRRHHGDADDDVDITVGWRTERHKRHGALRNRRHGSGDAGGQRHRRGRRHGDVRRVFGLDL